MDDQLFMIVVLVSEGKNFPRRALHQLLFEARFDGELLSTDGVNHVEQPEITQELAWQVSKKSLQHHRTHRTPIKIICYALDTRSSAREQIGYIVLDIRSAPDKPTKKWHALLNTKYRKSKPELKVAVYVEPAQPPKNMTTGSEKDDMSGEVDISTLHPILDDAQGFFQLGPASRCKDIFVLSITVAFTGNLTTLLPNTRNVSIDSQGFYFFYTIFNNDVMTEKFLDLLDPKFTAERASMRIRTSVDVLRLYFSRSAPVQFNLCTGDTSLGSAFVNLSDMIKEGESLAQPLLHEGAFELYPPSRFREIPSPVPNEIKPVIGVSIQIRREEVTKHEEVKKDAQLAEKVVQSEAAHTPNASDYSQAFATDSGSVESLPTKATKADNGGSPLSSLSKSIVVQKSTASLTTSDEHAVNSAQSRHYSFSLHMRTIKDITAQHNIYIYLKYSYPAFGNSSPVITHPAVEVRRGVEITLPNSFCSFDFAMTYSQLKQVISSDRFAVELWQYDHMTGNKCLGVGEIPIQNILTTSVTVVNVNGKTGAQHKMSANVPVMCNNSKVAELNTVFTLVDFGEILVNLVVQSEMGKRREDEGVATLASADPTETPEYRAALELEMWKEVQEKAFEKQLLDKERKYMTTMTEEFKKRDMERELLAKKKIAENNTLQQELSKMVNQLAKREKQISDKEHEVEQLKADLQHAYDRKLVDLKESSRRMEEDCQHKIELIRTRNKEADEHIFKLKEELLQAERKFQDLEKDFSFYKEQQHMKPEVKLQSEINLLTLEKVELERRLEASNKSKINYKQQFGRALKEIARLKEKANEEAKRQAHQQMQELEMMKQRYFATEEKEAMKVDRRDLEDIKEELQRHRTETLKNSPETIKEAKVAKKSHHDQALEDQIGRLQEERDGLLKTGVYNTDDPIIFELEKQIREAIQQHNTDAAT